MTNEKVVAEKKESVRTFDVDLAEKLEENKMATAKEFQQRKICAKYISITA